MYVRNVFQILQKRGIATEAEFNYGTEEHPSAEVYHSAFSRIHTINGAKHALVNSPVFMALSTTTAQPSGRVMALKVTKPMRTRDVKVGEGNPQAREKEGKLSLLRLEHNSSLSGIPGMLRSEFRGKPPLSDVLCSILHNWSLPSSSLACGLSLPAFIGNNSRVELSYSTNFFLGDQPTRQREMRVR